MVHSTAPTITFPLPEDAIPRVELNEGDVKAYRQLAEEIVANTLEREIEFRYKDSEELDPHHWKFVKAKERMRIYKRITPTETLVLMVLGVGFIEGTVESVLYGLHHKTTEEMRTTTAFINKSILDTAVLANLDLGTDDDPFRYLGLKWRVAHTPGGSLIKNRDVCNLECMGTAADAQGIKYGFQVLKSVDAPGFPPFPESVVIRAQMMLCCIFRQVSPNVVAFYAKGVFNLCGDLAEFMAYNTSADMVLSIARAVDCAAAKRLTTMVLQSDEPGKNNGSSRNLRSYLVKSEKDKFKGAACALCTKKPSMLSSSCRPCTICAEPVCGKCLVKRSVMAKPGNVRIVCCKICVMRAKQLDVDPRQPYPLISLLQPDEEYAM
ncbi:hypothetical protein Gpo141_00012666 [Globisporangium polare]